MNKTPAIVCSIVVVSVLVGCAQYYSNTAQPERQAQAQENFKQGPDTYK